MNRWTDGQMDGWTDKWTDERKKQISLKNLQEAVDNPLQHTLIFIATIVLLPNQHFLTNRTIYFGKKLLLFRDICCTPSRCLQEAVDELFQHTPECKLYF
jgi:hypothetical protein